MGGHVALPSSATIKIKKVGNEPKTKESIKIAIKDVNEKINSLRKLSVING